MPIRQRMKVLNHSYDICTITTNTNMFDIKKYITETGKTFCPGIILGDKHVPCKLYPHSTGEDKSVLRFDNSMPTVRGHDSNIDVELQICEPCYRARNPGLWSSPQGQVYRGEILSSPAVVATYIVYRTLFDGPNAWSTQQENRWLLKDSRTPACPGLVPIWIQEEVPTIIDILRLPVIMVLKWDEEKVSGVYIFK